MKESGFTHLLRNWGFLIICLAYLLGSCSVFPGGSSPTLIPTDQMVASTAVTIEAGQVTLAAPAGSISPTLAATTSPAESSLVSPAVTAQLVTALPVDETPVPSATADGATPTELPTATPSPLPAQGVPVAQIQILNPGPASKVISPLKVSVGLNPGPKGIVHLELLGEDGRLLVRKLVTYNPGGYVHLLEEMEFEINAVAEAGRLQISTEDADGRMNALASVDLLLLSMGPQDINPPGDLLEEVVIQQPTEKTFIQGGKLIVSGLARPVWSDPLIVDLIGPDGKLLAPTRLINITPASGGRHAEFSIEIPYTVTSPTWALLVIAERGDRIPGTAYLASREVLLGP